MERRLTAFLIPFLILVPLLFLFQREPETAKPVGPAGEAVASSAGEAAPAGGGEVQEGGAPANGGRALSPATVVEGQAGDNRFSHDFGVPGERGALRVVFDRRAASVVEVRLLDEPATLEASQVPVEQRVEEDFYPLVQPVQGGFVSLPTAFQRQSGLTVDPYQSRWDRVAGGDGEVVLQLVDADNGLTLRKTFHHRPGWRGLSMELSVEAAAERSSAATERTPAGASLLLAMRGLSVTNPRVDHVLGQNPAFVIGASAAPEGEVAIAVQRPHDQIEGPVAQRTTAGGIDFAGSTNRFFGAFLVPADEESRHALYRVERDLWPRPDPVRAPLDDHGFGSVPVPVYRFELPVPAPGGRTTVSYDLYLGPKSSGVFDEDPAYARFDAVMDVDLAPMCPCEIPGARAMAKFLLWLLRHLHSFFGNWGIAIVVMTLLVRGALVPFNFRMQKSMRAYGAKMMVLKPKLDKIKERYGDDPKKLQMEMAAFQREHKLIPPIGGCLPMFITIPVFLGLFTALRIAYELRYQPFFGWIDDLSQPDQLFALGLPWVPYFNLLPLLMVVLWLVLQAGTPLPEDPQQRQMMKIMRYMPVLFGIMLYNYASGLMVYMITSSVFGIVEQRVTRKILGPPPAVAGAAVPTF